MRSTEGAAGGRTGAGTAGSAETMGARTCLPPARAGRAAFRVSVLVGAALALASCSSGSGSSTSGTKPATTTTPATATTIPFDLSKNARQDVSTTGACAHAGSTWVLSGRVRNSSTTARPYQIVVDFVSQPGDTVLDTRIVQTATVAPGATADWSATSTPGLAGVACLVRQVQAPA